MALESEPARSAQVAARVGAGAASLAEHSTQLVRRLWRAARPRLQALMPVLRPVADASEAVWSWLAATWLGRVVTRTLRRRIVLSNLLGLMVLLVGISYISQHNVWLIDAKRESLRAQGEIIAQAIAASASVEGGALVIDPERLPAQSGSKAPYRDDGFAAFELSIKPERVTPVLRKLVEPTNNRVRIYAREGTLIADSERILRRGDIVSYTGAYSEKTGRPKAKNFWTRLTEFFLSGDIPVYKEIGDGNGMAYYEVRMALSGGSPAPMLLLTPQGEQIVSVAVPIQRMNSVLGVLLLSSKPGEIDDLLAEERWNLLMIGALALAASLLASLLLARTVAGPMRQLSSAAENVSRNINAMSELPRFDEREDEIGQMATSFQSMTAALYRRIESSEKFAADVAHELKNPLAAARSTAESLSYARTDEERNHLVGQIQAELMRLNRLITDVAAASRLDAELARQETGPVVMTEVIEGVAAIMRDKSVSVGCSLVLDIAAPAGDPRGAFLVEGHAGRLAQVLTNLVDNAISFSGEGKVVRVIARRVPGSVEIAVEDDGPGIAEDKLAKIFTRFYTYRPTATTSRGSNSGLGLSISREIVQAHGGEIWAENRYPRAGGGGDRRPLGARFVVRLPAADPATGRSKSHAGRRG